MGKRVKFVLSYIIAFFITFVSYAEAVSNVSKLAFSETQKRYERKAVMGVDLGLSSRAFPVVVKYCQKKCTSGVIQNYYITSEIEKLVESEAYDWLITQRFDKIIISSDEALIITGGSVEKVSIPAGRFFVFDTGSYSKFRKSLENYLEDLSDTVSKLLSAAIEARYEELPDKEKETFITTKAKELGIPVEIARKLMSSAYVFALYLEPVKDKSTLIISKRKRAKGVKYTASFNLYVKARLLIYRFDPDEKKFLFYKELKGKSGSVGKSATFYTYPTRAVTEPLFQKSIILAAKAVGINLSAKLKEDDNFAIFATVDRLSGNKIYSKIGVLEDLRIDAPYIVREMRDGKWKNVGWAKARHVAINCYKQDERENFSTFDLIKGKVAFKDQLREHPWTGLFFYFGIGMDSYTLDKLEDSKGTYTFNEGGGNFILGKIGLSLDLGYSFNSKFLSEVWLDVFFGVGGGGDSMESSSSFYSELSVSDNSTESPIYYTGGLGLYKRFYIGATGAYLMIGGNLLYQSMSATLKQNTSYSLSVSSLSLGLNAVGGYNISPDMEIFLNFGYNLPISSSAGIKENWYKSPVYEYDSVDVSGGVSAFVGLRWHMSIIGSIAKFYKKPSSICRNMNEEIKQK